jgi:hypothetical protein
VKEFDRKSRGSKLKGVGSYNEWESPAFFADSLVFRHPTFGGNPLKKLYKTELIGKTD